MFRNSIYILALSLILGPQSLASEIWGEGGFDTFSDRLPLVDASELSKNLGKQWTDVIFKTGVETTQILKADFASIDPVLERAAHEKLGILDLFTGKDLANPKARALFLDEKVLAKIDAKYNLFSVFMLSTNPKDKPKETLRMRYMIVGSGLLIVGYPHAAPVEIIDDGKLLEYQYEPIIQADIIHNAQTRGLFSVRTLPSPSPEFRDFKGPMGVSIRSYEINGNMIRVGYKLVLDQETQVPKKPIELRASIQPKAP